MPASSLQDSILAARDSRQQVLEQRLSAGQRATVFVSLNIPGSAKTPPGARVFFAAMLDRLLAACSVPQTLFTGEDALGPYAIASFDDSPLAVKQRCLALEADDPCARLADLDVYAADGVQVDRASLGLPARSCLICAQAAVDCMRNRRHSRAEIIGQAHALLARFSA